MRNFLTLILLVPRKKGSPQSAQRPQRKVPPLARALVFTLGMLTMVPALAAPQQTPKLSLKDAETLALRNHPLLQAANYEAEAAAK